MTAKNGHALLAGVLGDPVGHSLSPAIHEYWLERYHINGSYIPLHVTEADFMSAIRLCARMGFVGFNVTLPHKETAFHAMDVLDQTARISGAVNTILCRQDGIFYGMNTDIFGFRQLLLPFTREGKLDHKKVMVIGAGGAARAVMIALLECGCRHIVLANRTRKKAEKVVETVSASFDPVVIDVITLDEMMSYVPSQDYMINTVALNKAGAIDCDAIANAAKPDCVMIDISYGRDGTAFTRAARQAGRPYADGLKMLLWQAAPGFEKWFGVIPEVDETLYHHVDSQI